MRDLNSERVMVVGGTATVWQAVTLRMLPQDFKTRTWYGYGEDWPLVYDDLEPYYCKAEALLGVSGTDADNPFAPRRSSPYPLPAFELSYDDAIFADRLRQHGIVLHTTPQARTRAAYGGRPGMHELRHVPCLSDRRPLLPELPSPTRYRNRPLQSAYQYVRAQAGRG